MHCLRRSMVGPVDALRFQRCLFLQHFVRRSSFGLRPMGSPQATTRPPTPWATDEGGFAPRRRAGVGARRHVSDARLVGLRRSGCAGARSGPLPSPTDPHPGRSTTSPRLSDRPSQRCRIPHPGGPLGFSRSSSPARAASDSPAVVAAAVGFTRPNAAKPVHQQVIQSGGKRRSERWVGAPAGN